ncbi:MAG: hypothetical protein H7Y27_05020, partial [Gemmatimonadaceae bacterium]|nr:hypothetical protein [Chitinophagaceae bacterium]
MNPYLTMRAPLCANLKKLASIAAVLFLSLFVSITAQAGKVPELVWRNAVLESGVEGADGAIYRFPKVSSDVDALVKIKKRSDPLVTLVTIDLTGQGWDKAWQPQVAYNGGYAPGAADWYMEFEITFVDKETSIPSVVEEFQVTALDIDGNGDKIREYVSFYNQKSFLTEASTLLGNTSLLDDILGLLGGIVGRRFDGPTLNFLNIDTSGTAVMVTNTYENNNKFKVRTGGVSTAANGASDRMYALYFKSFDYTAPNEFALPVSVINWGATTNNNNVDLRWSTTFERNSSHFVIEKSTDGKHFTDAA